jgi:hypothetical protein
MTNRSSWSSLRPHSKPPQHPHVERRFHLCPQRGAISGERTDVPFHLSNSFAQLPHELGASGGEQPIDALHLEWWWR